MIRQPAIRPTADDRIKAALWFASQGFGIFSVWSTTASGLCRCGQGRACSSPGKHPITPHGFEDNTTDPARIRTLLSAGSEPNYGLVPPPGVFIWDADAPDWGAQIAALEARYGPLPATLRTRTAHGEHIFYRWPDDVPRPLGEMFGMVTRWGSGRGAGYVIGPRSVHPSGAVYAPADGSVFAIAVLPAAWASAALGPATGSTGDAAGGDTIRIVDGGYVLPDRVDEGGRYRAILAYTAHLYNKGLTPDDMWPLVMHRLSPRFAVLLSVDDLRSRFDRAVADLQGRLGPPRGTGSGIAPGGGAGAGYGADDESGAALLPIDSSSDFPDEPDPRAFGGLLGACVADIETGTDASRVGLLGSLIAFCGALVPTQAYFHRAQTSSPFIGLVGESGIGRKGTAMLRAHDSLVSHAGYDCIDGMYVNRIVLDGLASGEGLVTALHYKQESFKTEPTAALVFEEEYANLLASRQREGSTLDPKMRAAFDGSVLSVRKSASGESRSVSPPYWLPALIGITPAELRSRIEGGALTSGSANRWMYLPVRRRDIRVIPTVPEFAADRAQALADARRWALGRHGAYLEIADEVSTSLDDYAGWLTAQAAGLGADLTRRFSVIALRIALVHASVEQSGVITQDHLERAIALTEYARTGLGWVFGPVVGSPDARLLHRHLIAEGGRLAARAITRSIIRDPIRRQDAVDELQRLGIAKVERVVPGPSGGRPRSDLVLAEVMAGYGKGYGSGEGGGYGGFGPHAQPRARGRARDDGTPADAAITPPSRTDQAAITLPEPSHNPDVTPRTAARTGTQPERGENDDTGSVGRHPDGSVWCLYWRDHFAAHRDVQGTPWCEVCSPAASGDAV